MNLRKSKASETAFREVTASAEQQSVFRLAPHPALFEEGLYEALREQVPVIDAAISKLVRLTCGFAVECGNKEKEKQIREFFSELPVSVSGCSLSTFAEMYLDSLLTYGRAFGEILLSRQTGQLSGLYCADCTSFSVRSEGSETVIFNLLSGKKLVTKHPERLLYTCANPSPGHPAGASLLRGLPALSRVLMRIYEAVGQNFDRAGNVRYAVTYKPSGEGEAAFAKERAVEIARQWAEGMNSSKAGCIKDFVAVGDVDIKVIGADGMLLDTEIPVRQLLEQLVAKLSIPPFLLGLSWSTTERMSSQQADILTSEIDYYRRLLEKPLMKIIKLYRDINGIGEEVRIVWDNVNLQDEETLARARLYRAQAMEIEERLKGGEEDE